MASAFYDDLVAFPDDPHFASLAVKIGELGQRRRERGQRLLIGVGGSVAVGKSSMSERLVQHLVDQGLSAAILGTDGFLFPNDVLEQRGALMKKGFPESYDEANMVSVMQAFRESGGPLEVPRYSHDVFDIVGTRTVPAATVLVVEGVNALQPAIAAKLDLAIYLDVDRQAVLDWYLTRFEQLTASARSDPKSFYQRFTSLSPDDLRSVATDVWTSINLVNLEHFIEPTKNNAHIVIRLRADHSIDKLLVQRDLS